jgi:hypothetical protein
MSSEPFYDPAKSYLYNYEHGPSGLFADTTSGSQNIPLIHTFKSKGQLHEL